MATPTTTTPTHTTEGPAHGEAGAERGGIRGAISRVFGRDRPPAIQTAEEEERERETVSPYTFQKTEFVVRESTGRQVGKRGEKGAVAEVREVTFAQELVAQYENFLHDHIENLLKITNPQILDNDAHRHELRLREELTTDNKPDKEKIAKFLETPEGWMVTTQVVEQQTALKLFANGLHAATRPRGERVDQIDENTIRLHIDQGALNRVIMDRIAPFLTERVYITGGRPEERGLAGRFGNLRRWQLGLATALGSILPGIAAGGLARLAGGESPGVITAAAAAAAVAPGLAGVRRLLRSGVTIDLRQCSAALEAIQHDANEVAYLKSVLNIDANNYQVTAPNQIDLRPSHALSPNAIRQIQSEICQGLYAREQFYTSLGIPNELLDALPEQHLYFYFEGKAEQTGTRWQKRHEEIFQPQTAGILDTVGRPPTDQDFLTGGATLDFEGNLRRFMQARRQVIVEMMNDYAIKVRDGEESTDAITRFERKISARREGGEELERRKKVAGERKEELIKEKEQLETDKATVDEYTEARTEFEKTQEAYQTEFEQAYLNGRTIEEEIERINNLLYDESDPNSVAARRHGLLEQRNQDRVAAVGAATHDIAAAIAAGQQVTPESRKKIEDGYIERADALNQARISQLREEEDELKNRISRLKEIKEQQDNARKTLDQKADVITSTARENLPTLEVDFGELTGWGIGEAELRNMTVDELMQRINAINLTNPANGWDEAQNHDPNNRQRVINAVAEAKARHEEIFDTQKAVRDSDYNTLTGAAWGITPDQLRTMSEAQILILINNANVANNAIGWPPAENANPDNLLTMRNAIAEARNRMLLRHNAVITARIADLDAQIETEQERIDTISFESEIDVLATIKDLMGRQGKVFEISFDIASDRAKYIDVNPVDPDDPTFTNGEKAVFEGAVPPVGYWRIMNALFNHEKRTDRNEYVSKILKTLPPKALARRINLALGMPAGDPNIEDITIALNTLNTEIGNGNFTGIDIRSLFRDIINGLRRQADAI